MCDQLMSLPGGGGNFFIPALLEFISLLACQARDDSFLGVVSLGMLWVQPIMLLQGNLAGYFGAAACDAQA